MIKAVSNVLKKREERGILGSNDRITFLIQEESHEFSDDIIALLNEQMKKPPRIILFFEYHYSS